MELFGKMKQGRLEEGSATLRLKMDMTSPNPNMWDQVRLRHSEERLRRGFRLPAEPALVDGRHSVLDWAV